MKVARFTVNFFGENTYILWDDVTREAAIIDPGMLKSKEFETIDDYIAKNHLKLKYMLLTHLHLDHSFGVKYITDKYGLKPLCSEEENVLGANIPQQVANFHLKIDAQPVFIENGLRDGDTLYVGDEAINVIQIAGHSPGGLVYYCPESSFVITGDVLFKGSIGRTDLYGGNLNSLLNGIKEKLFILPDETLVCPGHGDSTTIGDEKYSNPYFK